MNVIQVFLSICNLLFALISVTGFNQKFKKECYISKSEIVCCYVVSMLYVINAIFIFISK